MKKPSPHEPLNASSVFKLTVRFTVFLLLLLFVLVLFYVSGNYQRFLDSTQRFVLTVSCPISILLCLLSSCGAVLSLAHLVRTGRPRFVLAAVIFIAIALSGAVLFLALRVILMVSSGL